MFENVEIVYIIENELEEEVLLKYQNEINNYYVICINDYKCKYISKFISINNILNISSFFNCIDSDNFLYLKPYEKLLINTNDLDNIPLNSNYYVQVKKLSKNNDKFLEDYKSTYSYEKRFFYKYGSEFNKVNFLIISNRINEFPEIFQLNIKKKVDLFEKEPQNLENTLYLYKKGKIDVDILNIVENIKNYSYEKKDLFYLYIELSNYYKEKNNFLAAKNFIYESLKVFPNSPISYFLLGKLFLNKNMNNKANRFFRKCSFLIENELFELELDFKKDFLLINSNYLLGTYYIKNKDYVSALDCFEKISEITNKFENLEQLISFTNQMLENPSNWYSDWKSYLNKDRKIWEKALNDSKKGENILIITLGGRKFSEIVNSILILALTLRGINVHLLLCDESMNACELITLSKQIGFQSFNFTEIDEFFNDGIKKNACKYCYKPIQNMYKEFNINNHKYSDYYNSEDLELIDNIVENIKFEDIKEYKFKGINVGQHAFSGTLRFFAVGELKGNKDEKYVLKEYLHSSILNVIVMENILNKINFTCVVSHHGIYVPYGVIGEVVRKKNIRVVNWCSAYRNQRFIFSHNDTYHYTLLEEPVEKWENINYNYIIENKIVNYVNSRYWGLNDWIKFHNEPKTTDLKVIKENTGIDFNKPCIGLLTNVIWDAQIHFSKNIFQNMLEWLFETVKYFETRKDLQLIIRIHPAEISGVIPSNQKVLDELNKKFNTLPENIFIINADNNISTYQLMSNCDSIIIYGTKTGIELSVYGLPVIVGGEAWVKNKGITIDPKSKEEYFNELSKLPLRKKLDNDKLIRARKYAFHYFCRRMIPIDCVEALKNRPLYRFSSESITDLLPGKNLGIDVICNGIINGEDFIYKAEILNEAYM